MPRGTVSLCSLCPAAEGSMAGINIRMSWLRRSILLRRLGLQQLCLRLVIRDGLGWCFCSGVAAQQSQESRVLSGSMSETLRVQIQRWAIWVRRDSRPGSAVVAVAVAHHHVGGMGIEPGEPLEGRDLCTTRSQNGSTMGETSRSAQYIVVPVKYR